MNDPAQQALERQQALYRETEGVIAFLVARYGDYTGSGFRLAIPLDEAFGLRQLLPNRDPVVIVGVDVDTRSYVIDVL